MQIPRRSHGFRSGVVAALAFIVPACAPDGNRQASTDVGDAEHWRVVDAYRVMDEAWHAAAAEERGEHPPIELAVAAARAIVRQPDHPRLPDAAEFLIEHPPGMVESAAEDLELGFAALALRLGPDWAVAETYQSDMAEWTQRRLEAMAEPAAQARQEALDRLNEAEPKPFRALAVAKAVADIDGHRRQRQAAAFLVRDGYRLGDSGNLALAGARLLVERFPEYNRWPSLLGALEVDTQRRGGNAAIERLFAGLAEVGEGEVRAMARYYQAAGLMRSANIFGISPQDRDDKRQQAIEVATGLSAGVGEETFDRTGQFGEDGMPFLGTFADAERELLDRLRHATAGGTLPEASGRRLDGVAESLSAFAGKVVFIDFWATWCAPCVKALPTLRELNDELPGSAFALLSVSADDELATVVEFQRDEPMPWANWHVGHDGELLDAWSVRAYPTYILVDGDGVILARSNLLHQPLLDVVRDSVNAAGAS